MRVLLVMMTLILAFPAFSHAKAQATHNRPVSTEGKGTLQSILQSETTLQEHQQAMELELRDTQKKLARLSTKKQKSIQANREKLQNRLKKLETTLKSIKRDKKTLASIRNEYQEKFGSLLSIQTQEKAGKKLASPQRDVIAIEMSEPSKTALLTEISSNQDDKRLMKIVTILIDHTKTMDDAEKQYWRNLPPSIPFEHRFRLLDILATERQNLAALEKTYKPKVQRLNKHHMADWEMIRAKGSGDKKIPAAKGKKKK